MRRWSSTYFPQTVSSCSSSSRCPAGDPGLSTASVAALTVYDMCKAVQKDMVITDIRLIDKTGGVHGDFHREDEA